MSDCDYYSSTGVFDWERWERALAWKREQDEQKFRRRLLMVVVGNAVLNATVQIVIALLT